MKADTIRIIECTEYYVWWLLNCSQNVDSKQIEQEVTPITAQLNDICLKMGDFLSSLIILEDIRIYGYNVSLYKEEKERMQEEWKVVWLKEEREKHHEEYRQLYCGQYAY